MKYKKISLWLLLVIISVILAAILLTCTDDNKLVIGKETSSILNSIPIQSKSKNLPLKSSNLKLTAISKKVDDSTSFIPPELSKQLQNARKKLPSIEEIRSNQDFYAHQVSPLLLEAADSLNRIHQLEQAFPNNKEAFNSFYRNCSIDRELPETINALCVEKYAVQGQYDEKFVDDFLNDLSPLVKRLYNLALKQ